MKAAVLEIREDKAAILDRDGLVRIVENNNYTVGQTIEVDSILIRENAGSKGTVIRLSRYFRKHAAAAAAVFALVLGGGTITAQAVPITTVTLDADSSIAYRLNVFDRVVGVEPYGEENREFADSVRAEVKGKKVGEAVSRTLELLDQNSAGKEDAASAGTEAAEHPLVVTIDSHFGKEAGLETVITDSIDQWNAGQEMNTAAPEAQNHAGFEATVIPMTGEMKEQGIQENRSPGRDLFEEKVKAAEEKAEAEAKAAEEAEKARAREEAAGEKLRKEEAVRPTAGETQESAHGQKDERPEAGTEPENGLHENAQEKPDHRPEAEKPGNGSENAAAPEDGGNAPETGDMPNGDMPDGELRNEGNQGGEMQSAEVQNSEMQGGASEGQPADTEGMTPQENMQGQENPENIADNSAQEQPAQQNTAGPGPGGEGAPGSGNDGYNSSENGAPAEGSGHGPGGERRFGPGNSEGSEGAER